MNVFLIYENKLFFSLVIYDWIVFIELYLFKDVKRIDLINDYY